MIHLREDLRKNEVVGCNKRLKSGLERSLYFCNAGGTQTNPLSYRVGALGTLPFNGGLGRWLSFFRAGGTEIRAWMDPSRTIGAFPCEVTVFVAAFGWQNHLFPVVSVDDDPFPAHLAFGRIPHHIVEPVNGSEQNIFG